MIIETNKIKLGNEEEFKKKELNDSIKTTLQKVPDNINQIKKLNIYSNGTTYFINGFNKK